MENLSVKEIKDIVQTSSYEQYLSYINILSKDKRESVKKIAMSLSKKLDAVRKEEERLKNMFIIEESLFAEGYKKIGGVDEAGRGPLAGPVVSACVILDKNPMIDGIDDSKKVSEKNRDRIFDTIVNSDIIYGIGISDSNEIDEYNILNATFLAMKRSIAMASQRPDFIIVDGNQQITDINHPQRCIVQGDSKSISIACASILAKVTRDRIMKQYAEIYPQYGFDKHKGYGTKEHIEAINKYGITPIHRISFLKNIY